MCGRYTISKSRELLGELLGCELAAEIELPVYNASPGQTLPVMLSGWPRKAVAAFWGFPPPRRAPGRMLINARAETVDERPTFRDSFRRRRCLVLADGFYEWQKTSQGKQPYRITLTSDDIFAFAGIWKLVSDVIHYVILTTEPNRVTRPIHDRMPVILEKAEQDRWLDPALPPSEVLGLLDPFPEDQMRAYRVSRDVNDSRNERPDLIDRIS